MGKGWLQAGPCYSWKRASLIIVLATMSCLTTVGLGYVAYHYLRALAAVRATRAIEKIAHTTTQAPFLSTGVFAELLQLACDTPTPLRSWNSQAAEEQLLALPLIKQCHIQKIKPDTLYITYQLREPIAYLGNYANTAIDEEGVFFPCQPFYSPLILPEVYLPSTDRSLSFLEGDAGAAGCPDPSPWGKQMDAELQGTLQSVLNFFTPGRVKRIDFCYHQAASLGKREIVVVLYPNNLKQGFLTRRCPQFESNEVGAEAAKRNRDAGGLKVSGCPTLSKTHASAGLGTDGELSLRLPSMGYQEALKQYALIADQVGPEIRLVDLRIAGVAYLQ